MLHQIEMMALVLSAMQPVFPRIVDDSDKIILQGCKDFHYLVLFLNELHDWFSVVEGGCDSATRESDRSLMVAGLLGN